MSVSKRKPMLPLETLDRHTCALCWKISSGPSKNAVPRDDRIAAAVSAAAREPPLLPLGSPKPLPCCWLPGWLLRCCKLLPPLPLLMLMPAPGNVTAAEASRSLPSLLARSCRREDAAADLLLRHSPAVPTAGPSICAGCAAPMWGAAASEAASGKTLLPPGRPLPRKPLPPAARRHCRTAARRSLRTANCSLFGSKGLLKSVCYALACMLTTMGQPVAMLGVEARTCQLRPPKLTMHWRARRA